jgi:hypothetical protein
LAFSDEGYKQQAVLHKRDSPEAIVGVPANNIFSLMKEMTK